MGPVAEETDAPPADDPDEPNQLDPLDPLTREESPPGVDPVVAPVPPE
jgi:hypothetical protein